jgi:hypothetical protein
VSVTFISEYVMFSNLFPILILYLKLYKHTKFEYCISLRDMTPCVLVISCQSIRRHMKTILSCIAVKILNNALTCFSWRFLGRYSWLNVCIGWRTQRVFAVMCWWNQLLGSERKIALRFILGTCLSWLVFSDCVSLLSMLYFRSDAWKYEF